jgi:hypothetical protein
MDQDMDLTIGSLNFHVGSLGSIRLSDPAKPGPSTSELKTVAMSESSEGSSSEVNSPVSLAETEEGKIAGGNEIMENFDLEVQLKDLMICHKSPKYRGTQRSRSPDKAYDYEDDEKEMGASCFTHRIRTTPVPKGFKLPHD